MANGSTGLTDTQVTRLVLLLQATPVEDLGRYRVLVNGRTIAAHDDVAAAIRQAAAHSGRVRDEQAGAEFSVAQVRRLALAAGAYQLAQSIRAGAR